MLSDNKENVNDKEKFETKILIVTDSCVRHVGGCDIGVDLRFGFNKGKKVQKEIIRNKTKEWSGRFISDCRRNSTRFARGHRPTLTVFTISLITKVVIRNGIRKINDESKL